MTSTGPYDEVEIARQRLASLSPNDASYFNAFNIFINKLIAHSVRARIPSGFEEAISLTKQVLDLAPPGHFFYSPALCLIGLAFIKRFKLLCDSNDLTQGVSHLEAAVESCLPSQPLYPAFVVNLASGLLNRYWACGEMKDLNRIIEISTTALSSSPQSAQHDSLLNNLATALKERASHLGSNSDLDTAITHIQSCLHLRPPGHPSRHSALGNLAAAMLLKYEFDGNSQDLENAASHYAAALQLHSPDGEGYLLYLTGLGIVHCHLFHVDGNVERLETAIGFYQMAMGHSGLSGIDRSRLLDNYSVALLARYALLGNVYDLDQAIHCLTTSSGMLSPEYHGRRATLLNLGIAYITHFEATGNVADLDVALEKLDSVNQSGSPLYPVVLSARSIALASRSIARDDTQELSLALSMCKDALTMLSPRRPDYSVTMTALTSVLLDCFDRLGNSEEYQTIVDLCDRALASTPPAAPIVISLKLNRATAFLQKIQSGGEEMDIDTCIAGFREVIPTIPEGHKEHVRAHMQLGIVFETRFVLGGDSGKDLDESIALYRAARRGCNREKHYYIQVAIRLGNALRHSSEYKNSADALDEAIVVLAEAEEMLSATLRKAEYKVCLVDLGIALFTRFQAQRSRDDLDAGIERVSLALTLPPSKDEFLFLFTLATLLAVRYQEDQSLEDLERSVELFGAAAKQMPPKHYARGLLCRNYAIAMKDLGSRRDQPQYLNAAVAFLIEAFQSFPPSHYQQLLTCLSLAHVLSSRALLQRSDVDLASTINLLKGTIASLPQDSPTSHALFHCGAKLYLSLYKLSQQPSWMEEGFRYYEMAAHYTYENSAWCVTMALDWVEDAERLHHASVLRAYQASLDLLNQHLLATGAPIKHRHTALVYKKWVHHTGTLATDATACAITQDALALAAEFSEQGRGMLWTQLALDRTPLDGLRSAGDTGRELASAFERVSTQLTRCAVTQDRVPLAVTAPRLAVEAAARQYRQLSQEMADLVVRIRQLDGFRSFLGRPSFEELQHAAVGGPVILVNVSSKRCDAVIVLHNAPPCLVPLPGASLDQLTALSAHFHQVLRTMTRVGQETRREREVALVLRTLWDTVVRPIVDALTGPLGVPRGARIWWCPTSALTTLPLHAAGPYRRGAPSLPSIYVSSYTPTLSALIRARRQATSASALPPAFAAIGQANPGGEGGGLVLPSVAAELALVASLLPPRASPPSHVPSYTLTTLEGDASTADAVLDALATHPWAHIACHGYARPDRPFEACFALRDRVLTVLDILRARAPAQAAPHDRDRGGGSGGSSGGNGGGGGGGGGGELAFLSACHTAANPTAGRAPDELLHLAAAMQFGGFQSVVGTLWAVDDGMVQHMVRAFYEGMFPPSTSTPRDGDSGDPASEVMWDCTRAAGALNRAAMVVDKAHVSLDQRIVFIHIGA